MGDNAVDSFEHEANELLTLMEGSLLRLEDTPGDEGLINDIFRSAHTIKGTSGVFGFDNIVEFTHIVENLLDHVREGTISIDEKLIAILLSCRDHIGVLVDLAIAGQEDLPTEIVDNGKVLIEQLNVYLGSEADDGMGQEEMKALVEKHDNWHISLKYDKEVLQNGMDPISFLKYLGKLGDVTGVTLLYGGLPALSDTNPEHCYLSYEINLQGKEDIDKKQIESVFEFVQELCEIYILPPSNKIALFAEMIEQLPLPEEEMRLGEILVACGALTENELAQALKEQEARIEEGGMDAKPIGEVLIEERVVQEEVVTAALNKQSRVAEKARAGNRVLRVDAEKLDTLINLVGELVISGASTNLLAHKLGDEKLLESMSNMERLVEEIRDSSLNLRMVQIEETFTRFKRVVRDVSKELGKDIQLSIHGAETELDKSVIDQIGDPLMHLVRNSMDHGIESAQERRAAGKPVEGTLKLNAFHDSGNIVIEVSDDGRGLAKDKIIAKAIQKGLITDASIMSDSEIYQLVFEPGFSTVEQVTNLSGRGVGMDVVRRNIAALRGNVDITSEEGKGTTVSIRLPLTLAIIDGFLVAVGGSSYVIPLDMIHECIELSEEERKEVALQSYLNLRGEVLPFLRLREFFRDTNSTTDRENIVVVQYGNHKAGFVVDELLGEFQTVIKPMGKILQRLKGISGATILGSGDVAVILDVPNLVQRASHIAAMSQEGKPTGDVPVLH